MYDYHEQPRVMYNGGAQFIRICPHCGRFVRADKSIMLNGFDEVKEGPNACCSKCGRVAMPFEGYFDETGDV